MGKKTTNLDMLQQERTCAVQSLPDYRLIKPHILWVPNYSKSKFRKQPFIINLQDEYSLLKSLLLLNKE